MFQHAPDERFVTGDDLGHQRLTPTFRRPGV